MHHSGLSVIFVGSTKSVFVSRSAEALSEAGISVTILDPYAQVAAHRPGLIRKIARSLRHSVCLARGLLSLPRHDAIIIHSLGRGLIVQAILSRLRAPRVIGIAYGSDVLRRDRRFDWLLNFGLKRLTQVVATNKNVVDEIGSFSKASTPTIVRFGLPVLDAIRHLEAHPLDRSSLRKSIGIYSEKTVVSIGYSATLGQRQIELVRLFRDKESDLSHILFIVPVQYGDSSVRTSIVEECSRYNLEIGRELFLPITEFFDVEKSAKLRISTDILINNSVSDSFSGTVQEVLYSGNCVLASEGLPYITMPGNGVGIRTYKDIDEIVRQLSFYSIQEWKCQASARKGEIKAGIWEASAWSEVIDDWRRLIKPYDSQPKAQDSSIGAGT